MSLCTSDATLSPYLSLFFFFCSGARARIFDCAPIRFLSFVRRENKPLFARKNAVFKTKIRERTSGARRLREVNSDKTSLSFGPSFRFFIAIGFRASVPRVGFPKIKDTVARVAPSHF